MNLELVKTLSYSCQYSNTCIKKLHYKDENGLDHIQTQYCCWCHFKPASMKLIKK